jgi:hypothetical protein
MNEEALKKIIEESGESSCKIKALENENENLKEQVKFLTETVLLMKEILKSEGIL